MRVPRLFCLVAVAATAACTGTSSPPTTAPSATRSVSGPWSGSYVPVCSNYPNCGSVGGALNGPQAFALTLRQDGGALSGQINLTGNWLTRVANVTGTIASDGTMTLQGGDSWPASDLCAPAGGWSITGWNGRYDAVRDTISGDFAFVTQKHLTSCYWTSDLRVNATAMSLSHGTLPAASLAGHWQGMYAIRGCTPVGWTICPKPIGSDVPLDLQLVQDGSLVSGAITGIPFSNLTALAVTGTAGANASTLVLDGSRSESVSAATHVVRLTSWSVTIDAVGRMQGTFSYIDENQWTQGPSAGTTSSYSYDADLKYVVRVPW
jgi:hypothetical protein